MTENEALIILENLKPVCEEQLVFPEGEICEAFDAAITALTEIQQYREIGTVGECKELASMFSRRVPRSGGEAESYEGE